MCTLFHSPSFASPTLDRNSEQLFREERTATPEGSEGRREIKRNFFGIKLDKIKHFLIHPLATLEYQSVQAAASSSDRRFISQALIRLSHQGSVERNVRKK